MVFRNLKERMKEMLYVVKIGYGDEFAFESDVTAITIATQLAKADLGEHEISVKVFNDESEVDSDE